MTINSNLASSRDFFKDLIFSSRSLINKVSGLPLVREKSGKFKVREKSGNFRICQGNLEFC